MLRFVMPVILIAISVTGFFLFTKILYDETLGLRAQVASYDEALNNSKMLENERDKLTKKYNTISEDNLVRIQKFLPDNVDNIRLILEIEKIATPYGMALRDVKYDTTKQDTATKSGTVVQSGGSGSSSLNKEYGTWNLEFSTEGSYNNFLNFVRDLENNLRIVDIASIQFSSQVPVKFPFSESYKYAFKIKTYWLKN